MNKLLTAFWISFPEDSFAIKNFGVTAYSIDDAYSLLKVLGYDYYRTAKKIEVKENVKWDELEENHVRPNIGPIVVRGVWYPNEFGRDV
jgi:hypothetical protein